MKITRDTSDQLILADTPWLIGILLSIFILAFVGPGLALTLSGEWAGLIFALGGGGLGFAAFAVFVRRVQVILDRPSNAVLIRRRSLFGYSRVLHALTDLERAILETTRSDSGGTLARPILVLRGMSAGRHPIVSAYTSGPGPETLVHAINDWLARTRPAEPGHLDSAPGAH